MTVQMLISLLSATDSYAEVYVLSQPDWPLVSGHAGPDLDDYYEELAHEILPEPTDVVLARIEGFDQWRVARSDGGERRARAAMVPRPRKRG